MLLVSRQRQLKTEARIPLSKGLIYMLISSVIWMGSSFLVHSIAGRMLGPISYGTFGIIYAFISTSYIVLGGGVKRAVTKYTAGSPAQAGDIRIAGIKVQLYISAVIVVVLFIISKPASIWFNDEGLKILIRYSAIIVPVAGILYVYVGYFDGCKQFGRTATTTVAHSVLKVVFVFVLLYFGYEMFGAITGLLLGLGCTLFLATLLGRNAPLAKKFHQTTIIRYALPVLAFFICISILMHLDLFFVKALLDDPAKSGHYAAAQTLSRLIAFAMFPFGIVLFPSISCAIANNDLNLVRKYIQGSLRYILIILIPTCMLLILTAEQLLSYVYGVRYASGANALRILFIGASCWGITNSLVAIIQGYGQPGRPALILAGLIPMDIILIQIFTRKFGIEGAAAATACTFTMGMILVAITIYQRFGTLINSSTVINLLIASHVASAQFIFLKPSGIFLLLSYLFSICLYIGALWLLGELKRKDLDLMLSAISFEHPRSLLMKK